MIEKITYRKKIDLKSHFFHKSEKGKLEGEIVQEREGKGEGRVELGKGGGGGKIKEGCVKDKRERGHK